MNYLSGWRPTANDPTVNVPKMVANNTRVWVYTGNGGDRHKAGCQPAGERHPDQQQGLRRQIPGQGRYNGVFNFPDSGAHLAVLG
ncbi:hypothetical protein Mkiyose1088_47090 [Mycobacterium kiyosense]|nr:hypothetical protein Mkiyose1088_47090 [Mycobacterium kiyosense]